MTRSEDRARDRKCVGWAAGSGTHSAALTNVRRNGAVLRVRGAELGHRTKARERRAQVTEGYAS
jgi:hypothetical protein